MTRYRKDQTAGAGRKPVRAARMLWCASMMAAALCATDAPAQAPAGTLEVEPRIGVLRHDLSRHTADHLIVGLRVGSARPGMVRLGAVLDGWRDRIDLGATLGNRKVNSTYLLYGLGVEVGSPRVFATAGAGGETVFFGERYEAASFLPETSTSPQGSLGIGGRLPLGGEESPWGLRLEARTHAIYAEVFDPLGVEEGRELSWNPAASLGVTYRVR